MATCPTCRQQLPDGATRCPGCTRAPDPAEADASAGELTVPISSPGKVLVPPPVLPTAPLPQPMVEPIQTPTTAAPDSKPLAENPVLSRPLRGKSSVVTVPNPPRAAVAATPAPVTLREFTPPDSPAGRASLLPGDVLEHSLDELEQLLTARGQPVTLRFRRGDRYRTRTVTVQL